MQDDATRVGALPRLPQYHVLCVGDLLVLTGDLDPMAPWRHGQPGQARIGCTLPAALEAAQVGQRVILDDGKMTGVIESVSADGLRVRILTASAGARGSERKRGSTSPTPISPWAP